MKNSNGVKLIKQRAVQSKFESNEKHKILKKTQLRNNISNNNIGCL